MEGDGINETIILTFATEGTETIVASAAMHDSLAASVESFATAATTAYAQASAASKSMFDAMAAQYAAAGAGQSKFMATQMQEAAAIRGGSASIDEQIAALRTLATTMESYGAMGGGAAAQVATGYAAVNAEITKLIGLQESLNEEQARHARIAGNALAVEGYLAEADAIVTANGALALQQIQLQDIATKLKKDAVEYAAMGEEGVAAAEASAEALTVVQAALASIAAEQRVVIAGMAGIGESAAASSNLAVSSLGKVMAKLVGLNSGLVSMATSMLPLAAVVGSVMLTKNSIESMAELEKYHQRMGIATEDLSVLSMAAEKVGIKMNDVAIGMRMFDRHVDEAVEGRGKLVINNFKSIGLSMDDLKHKDPMTLFLKFATAISQIEDPTVRSAKATELMGRASERLIPFMNLLAGEGFSKLVVEASRLGIVVSGSAAKSALEFEKNWAQVKLEMVAVGNVIATSVLPLLRELTEPPKDNGYLNFLQELTYALKFVANAASAAYEAGKLLSGASFVKAFAVGGLEQLNPKNFRDVQGSAKRLWERTTEPITSFKNITGNMWGDQTKSPVVPKGDVYDRGTEQEQVDKAAERLTISRDQLDISTKQAAISGAQTGEQARQLEYQLKLLQIQKQIDSANRSIDSMKGVDPASKAQLKILELQRAHQEMIAAANEYNKVETASVTTQNDAVTAAREQLAAARLHVAVVSAENVMQAIGLDYVAKRRDIENDRDQKLRSINSQLLQKAIDPGTAEALRANAFSMAQEQINAAEVETKRRVSDTVRAEEEAVRVLQDRLAVQRLDTQAAGGTSAMMKEQLSFAQKQLAIQNDLDAATRRITAPGPNALPQEEQRKQLALEHAAAEQKLTAALLDQLSIEMRITLAEAATTREMNLAADADERSLQIARNSIALELLNQHTIQTTSDIQRELALERQNALISLADKRAQIDEDERRALEEQSLVVADAMAKAMLLGVDDPAAIEAAFARIAAIRRKANSERVQAELQTQSTIANGEFQSIQKTNAAWAEARYQKRIMDAQAMANAAQDLAIVFGDPMMQVAADFLHFLVDGMKKAADQANEIWRTVGDNIAQGFSTLFSTLSHGGGLSAAFKDMGQQFESSFGSIIENRIKVWSVELTKLAQGQPLLDANGKVMTDAAGNVQFSKQPDRDAQLKLAALQAAQIGIGAYGAGTGHGQATTSAMSGVVTGATTGAMIGSVIPGIGTVVGGVVGAVVGLIASEIGSALATQQRQSEYLYGVPNFYGGKATMIAERNINPQKSHELISQLQDSFNTAWNGFVGVMGKLGGNVPGMPAFMSGQFQPAPSANWEKHFQQYLTDTLPLQIAGMFKAGMERSFVASGVTSEAFDKFWAEANALDPTKRMQFWSDLADGIVSFAHAQSVFEGVKRLGGDYAGAKFDANGNALLGGDNDFMSALRTGAKGVYDIARNMVSLVGPDRIAAFKQMGASVDQIAASFAQFIQQVGQSLKNVRQQFNDAYLQHNLEAAGEVRDANGVIIHKDDPNAKARLLEQAYNQNLYKINNASNLGLNPQDVEALTQQSIQYLNQIFALDPTAAANDWWMKQMAILQSSSEAALKLMGDAATTEMGKFLDSIKPFKDYMLGIPFEIDPSIIALEKEFDGLAAAIAALTVSITNNTPPDDFNGDKPGKGIGDGQNPKLNPDLPGDYVGPNSVGNVGAQSYVVTDNGTTVNIYGGVFVGMSEFQEAVNNGVALANRENPQKFRSAF